MNIAPIGVTRIVPKSEYNLKIYKDLVDIWGCHTELRERILKDNSRIILGYKSDKKLATNVQKYSADEWLQAEKVISTEIYGHKKSLIQHQVEKTVYNKIGDILKHIHIIKDLKDKKLTQQTNILKDLIQGIDQSILKITEHNDNPKYQGLSKISKERISESSYIEKFYSKTGELKYQTTESISGYEEDGMWKYWG